MKTMADTSDYVKVLTTNYRFFWRCKNYNGELS